MRLVIDKLAKAYGFLWALKDLHCDLAPGELVALLGPNGAGKTTLLKLLAGLIAPTTGTIRIAGAPVARAKIGLLTPADHLYDNLTVTENLRFFSALYNRRQPPAALQEALAAVRLTDRADDYVANLSSGLKCRVSIAKWLLLDPELLLLDEPYGVLDGPGVDLLEKFLLAQCAKGHIVIMASHHVARVLKLCSRALILHQGRLTFNEAKQRPWTSFDRAYGEFLPQGESWSS
ncbi:MAG: heme ABC exporter ATP-binding protein CcmA [Candidatus Binatia bacterium]